MNERLKKLRDETNKLTNAQFSNSDSSQERVITAGQNSDTYSTNAASRVDDTSRLSSNGIDIPNFNKTDSSNFKIHGVNS